jgi:flagellin-like hook-associated protein FlgL
MQVDKETGEITPANARPITDTLRHLRGGVFMDEASDALQELVAEEGGNFALAGWDWRYYAEKLRQRRANFDDASIKPYLALDNMIDGVEGSETDDITQGISDLNQMHSNLTLSQVQNGSDQTVVQSQLDVLDETSLRFKSTLSEIEDLDYAAAVTRMNKEMMALEAAMGSFSKISGLSLFDYIRG